MSNKVVVGVNDALKSMSSNLVDCIVNPVLAAIQANQIAMAQEFESFMLTAFDITKDGEGNTTYVLKTIEITVNGLPQKVPVISILPTPKTFSINRMEINFQFEVTGSTEDKKEKTASEISTELSAKLGVLWSPKYKIEGKVATSGSTETSTSNLDVKATYNIALVATSEPSRVGDFTKTLLELYGIKQVVTEDVPQQEI